MLPHVFSAVGQHFCFRVSYEAVSKCKISSRRARELRGKGIKLYIPDGNRQQFFHGVRHLIRIQDMNFKGSLSEVHDIPQINSPVTIVCYLQQPFSAIIPAS